MGGRLSGCTSRPGGGQRGAAARAAGPGRWPGCPAMLAGRVAPRNSLRSLRSLRSDNRGGLDHEVRCAHRPRRLRFSAAPTRPITPLPDGTLLPLGRFKW